MRVVTRPGNHYTIKHYLGGALPARLGDEMSGQSILLLGLAASGSAALGSSLLASLTISAAIGGPLLGAILDRVAHPGRTLALAICLYATGIAMIGLMLGHVPFGLIMGIALASGLFMPSISGGWSSRLKSFIADDHLARASAIDATSFNIAGLAGPAVAGLIAAWVGAGWAIAAVVCLMLAALPMAWALPAPPARSGKHNTSLLQDVVTGFRIIVEQPALLRVTLVSVISCIGVGALWVISPLIGDIEFGNAGYGGLLLSALAIGALLATTLYGRWPPRQGPDRVIFTATLILAAGIFALAIGQSPIISLVAMFIAGMADGPQLAATFDVRHRESPERSRSQVFTTASSMKIAAFAIGAGLAGQLAGTSLQTTILAAGAAQILAAGAWLAIRVD